MKRFLLVAVINFLFTLSLIQAQTFTQSVTSKTLTNPTEQWKNINDLQKDIDELLESSDLKNAQVGIYVQSIQSGEVIYKRNHEKNFIPASTSKLITSSAALDILGTDFQFNTEMYLAGDKDANGEFKGNIIIRGFGDPTNSQFYTNNPYNVFDEFIDKLDSLGIKSIKGNIIGDDSYLDNQYYGQGWAWDDMIFPYSAQINAINFMDNKIDCIVEQGDSIGMTAKIKIVPDNSYVRVINNVKTVQKTEVSEIIAARDAITNIITLSGSVGFDSLKKENSIISVAVDNPTLFFLNIFKDRILKRKIKYRGALLDIDDLNDRPFYPKLKQASQLFSKNLTEVVKDINKNSNNLTAEIILKTIGKEVTGTGSTKKGIEQISKYLSKMGISFDNIGYVDGSGLSRLNLISPVNQVRLLSEIQKMPYKDIFLNSLAQPGENGTLKRRMTKTLAEGNIFAKTGSMDNVTCICGYARTKDKELLAFSIMINNFTVPGNLVRNIQDLICMRLAGFKR